MTSAMTTLEQLEKWFMDEMNYLASLPDEPDPGPEPLFLPRHRMGVHLIQSREGDLKYIEDLRPPAVKILDPDPNVVRRVLNALDPNGVCILRDHPLSEQKADMKRDPEGTGRRHAQDWIAKLTTGRYKEFGKDPRIVVCGINEPDVHTKEEEQIVFRYTKVFLEVLTQAGIRALALNLSVGWPRNLGEGTPVYWDTFLPLEDEILRGNHFLCVHEYWYPDLASRWGWYANRISQCPMAVPIIIGECGYTRQLAGLPQPWGWKGNIDARAYAGQLWEYHDKVHPNVFAILPFTSGFASPDWESKDILPVASSIIALKRDYDWPDEWPLKGEDDMPLSIVWPKMEKINGFFGSMYTNSSGGKYAHEGLDISRVTGTPVYSPFEGVVAFAGVDAAYGNYVRTYHPRLKTCFFFAHLSELRVQQGNSLVKGQLLGLTGNSGNSSGPHLHFEVRRMNEDAGYVQGVSAHANARVDPQGWLAGWIASGNTYEIK